MNLSSPADARNRGRFWLALSLSSVTALAVTIPLAFRAADAGQQNNPASSEITTPVAETIDPEQTEDSIVVGSSATSTTSSILTIDERSDVEAELVIQPGTSPQTQVTTTTSTSTTTTTESPAESTSVPDESTTSSPTPSSEPDETGG